MNESKKNKILDELVQFARIALMGDHSQTEAFVRRLARSLKREEPHAADSLRDLVTASASRGKAVQGARAASAPLVPVDHESRLDLLRIESAPTLLSPPILTNTIAPLIEQVIAERERLAELLHEDLDPSRTILFTGPPGVGKTLTAHWIAQRLQKPLFTLDLSSVMSSLLGRTGSNLRSVLDYAKAHDCVLLLDEFDAVAKRRNDDTEIGELKRLVTVLLQEIDLWPSDRLLIAATNHRDLLDPAIWRRFDVVIDFPMPVSSDLASVIEQELGQTVDPSLSQALSVVMEGSSFSDVVRTLRRVRRQSVLNGIPMEVMILQTITDDLKDLNKAGIKKVGTALEQAGVSQRQISEITGLSRDTIRRARPLEEASDG